MNKFDPIDDIKVKTKQVVKKVQYDRQVRTYANLDDLPRGIASNQITEGCMVLEGGAFRGCYTSGVLDALMEADINLRTTIGVSAGAMNGVGYVCGQIGRSAYINLKYRNDDRYVGLQAMRTNHGIIGFDFAMLELNKEYPVDMTRFNAPNRDFIAVVTNCKTGKPEYMKKGVCKDIIGAVAASASMPYVSQMMEIEGQPYLDGGCSCAIPYQWALDHHFENIVVVRTRDIEFRYPEEPNHNAMIRARYLNYPNLVKVLEEGDMRYNKQCNELEQLRNEGRIFMISPSQPIDIGRLEKDTSRLAEIYYLGYADGKRCVPSLKAYLHRGDRNDL